MFGDKPMLGVASRKVDAKKRIWLPKFTCAENDDKVFVITKDDYCELWGYDELIKRATYLKEKIETTIDIELKQNYQKLYDELTSFASCDFSDHSYRTINSSSRVTLPKDVVDKYQIDDEVTIEGKLDHIRIWKPLDFENYKRRLKSK